jgi:twinkle protein
MNAGYEAAGAALGFPQDIDFAAFYAQTQHHVKVLGAEHFADEVIANMRAAPLARVPSLPWRKTHGKVGFREGEVTLHLGINGHGKSLATGMLSLSLCAQQQRVCVASFEMKPWRTIERMVYQTLHTGTPSDEQFMALFKWLKGRMYLWDQQGRVKQDELFGVIRFAKEERGVTHFFVDSLMKCTAREDDYNEQKGFVDALTVLARDLNVHVHLVHHSRKTANEAQRPGKMDAKGSGVITDLVDNVLIWWRNKGKEEAIQAGEGYDPLAPDALLSVEKQRNGRWEGKVGLYFLPESTQFVASPTSAPINLMDGFDSRFQ